MKLTNHNDTVLSKNIEPTLNLSDIEISTGPKCSFTGRYADFYIGLASIASDTNVHIMGAVSKEMVETGINKLLGQGWDDIKWPVVLDMRKKVVYHSYDAYKKGASAILGWQALQASF